MITKYNTLLKLPKEVLLNRAANLRVKCSGSKIHLCAIINIRSGQCMMDCRFCAQSGRYHSDIINYPLLSDEELWHRIEKLSQLPIANIGLVASGVSLAGEEFDRLAAFLAALEPGIKKKLCVSLGALSREKMLILLNSGIGHYHHNLETASNYYGNVCSTQTWQSRRATVLRALELGFEICCGCLFGLGETWRDRIELALTLKNMEIKNIPLNFLIPQPKTPFEKLPVMKTQEALAIIAIFRHIIPDSFLRVCGGRSQTFGARQQEIFRAGANALMTGDYLTTKGESILHDRRMLEEIGLTI